MSERTKEQIRLFRQYGQDTEKLLTEYPALENVKVFSDRHEGLLEWYGFRRGTSLLLMGGGGGALVPMLLGKGLLVTVCEADADERELVSDRVRARFPEGSADSAVLQNLRFAEGEDALPEDAVYDYILFDGTLTPGEAGEKQAAAAKKRLAPGGILLAAADHAYGVRAFAGAEREKTAVGKAALQRMLQAGEAGSLTWYYPEPLRGLPGEIFSDRRLPGAGELSRVIPAYGFPAYLAIDVGARYDEICRDGVFPDYADAFLCFWQRENCGAAAGTAAASGTSTAGEAAASGTSTAGEAAAGSTSTVGAAANAGEPVYVKYNRNRRREYQLKTVIRERTEGGERIRSVEKQALHPEGEDHIRAFEKHFALLTEEGRGIRYTAPVFPENRDGNALVSFAWAEGESLTGTILKEIGARSAGKTGEERLAAVAGPVQEALSRLTDGGELHNLDSIFDNFLVGGDPGQSFEEALQNLTGIDYEWVSDTPADRGFVRYRALRAFHEQQREPLKLPPLTEFLALFGVSPEEEGRCELLEARFQEDVSGGSQSVYLDRFLTEVRDQRTIEKTERELRTANERLQGFRAELREKDTTIRKMTEVKRLTDNHVTNLEAIIRDLRHENGELGNTLTYLNSHQTVYSRLRRKAGDAFNRKYPKGSVERKKLEYRKDALLHPIRHRRALSTEEGRNLVEGDFAIGDIYRQRGKLFFPAEERPRVSIVIPCYNQIAYTYACLASIRDHTGDVSYEIIIADDVSTDATKNLDHFAEGLVISRNVVNQGFLKNCNQAAGKARGEFIFFLNNDTTVTEGWLSSLVELMDRDPSVGMCGSKLVYPDGRLQEAGGIIWSDGSGWNYGRLQDPDAPEYNYVKDVDYISGAAILIRKSLWQEIGGFDERYAPAYCEDSDLAFEVRRHGYRVVYQPKSVVTHFEGVSNGTDVQGTGLKRYQVENGEKLREKWKEELRNQSENTGNPDPFRARERSQGKKIILVVDHYVPTYDRDAGSRTTWQYLKMFLHEGYVVKFLGDNFAHEEPYTTELQQMGVEVLYGQAMQAGIWEWIERHEKDLHLVYLNRPHIASKYIDFIQSRTKLKVIYYGHDLHFLRERREYELTGDISHKESSEYWKTVELALMHKADMNYYPSDAEVRAIHAIDPEIPVKAITAYLWEDFPGDAGSSADAAPAPAGAESAAETAAGAPAVMETAAVSVSEPAVDAEAYRKQEGLLFVGGFAHPPNADAVRWFMQEIWPALKKQCPTLTFHVVGSRAPEEILAMNDPEHGVVIHGFVSDEELSRLYRTLSMVVVPLRYGAGVKGKVIEAMYYGAPVVTTSVGAEGIPGADAVMRIADRPEAFAEEVLKLLSDPAALETAGAAGLRYVKEHHSLDAAWSVIREDFA